MITKRGKLWVVTIGNKEEVCVSEAVAKSVLSKYSKAKTPLEELAAKAPAYSTFKIAPKQMEEDEDPSDDEE